MIPFLLIAHSLLGSYRRLLWREVLTKATRSIIYFGKRPNWIWSLNTKWTKPHWSWPHSQRKKENKVPLETPLITSLHHTGLSPLPYLSAWQQFLSVLTICPCQRDHIYQWNTFSAGSEAEPLVSFTRAGFRHNERSIPHHTCGIAVICLAALWLPTCPALQFKLGAIDCV